MKLYLNDYTAETLEKAESILFNGNGLIGVRGNLEEAEYDYYQSTRETYLNGFYETSPVSYPEKMIGFTESSESMISVVDGQTTLIKIGSEDFRIDQGQLGEVERFVDLERGITVRKLLWTSPQGFATRIKIERLTSFVNKNLFLTNFTFEKIDHELPIRLETHLNFRSQRKTDPNDPRAGHAAAEVEITKLDLAQQRCQFATVSSRLQAELAWDIGTDDCQYQILPDKLVITSLLVTDTTYTKKLSYAFHDYHHENLSHSFTEESALQAAFLADFWRDAKIGIKSREKFEESVNYSIYALLQSVGTDGKTSIAAKGLSGNGYGGHYFWDTEMYIFPVFLNINPAIARQILQYRINTLPQALANRALFGYHSGALYPWRTISGRESSAFFEAGSAQHHLNADIAYAIISYLERTGDYELLLEGGYEVLIETARVFTEIGYLKAGTFHLDKLTGPDEYTVLVNDNYYTNRLVQHQFEWVARLGEQLAQNHPVFWQELSERLEITTDELNQMRFYAGCMQKYFAADTGIVAQDRDFLHKAAWPFSPAETKYPLLLNYHPLVIYRYQICKQADAVLALMLFPADLSQKTQEKTVAYYDKITTHDSSLSYSIFSTVYSRLGKVEKGYEYFLKNVRLDLDNLHHNTKDGLHTASMGGVYLSIINGFCNLQIQGEEISLTPHLPAEISEIDFKISYQGQRYGIHVDHNGYQVAVVD